MTQKHNIPCGNTSCPDHNNKADLHCDKTCNGAPFAAVCEDHTPDPFENMISIQDCRGNIPKNGSNVDKKTCSRCSNLGYLAACHDQPYPEFWCKAGKWDGIESTDDLHEEVECEEFEEAK